MSVPKPPLRKVIRCWRLQIDSRSGSERVGMTCSLNSFRDILRQIAGAEKLLLFAVRGSGVASERHSRPRSNLSRAGARFVDFASPKSGPLVSTKTGAANT